MAISLASSIIDKTNITSLVARIMAGETFVVASTGPSGYTRQFQHQDWIDFVDPVQAGGNNGFNERFHALESEFDLISTAITSVDNVVNNLQSAPPAVGLTIALSIANGATIPVPTGFQASETKFFAFVKLYEFDLLGGSQSAGFRVLADTNGVVTAVPVGTGTGQSVLATGIAISKRGGW
jgi:hypothetical protein